MLCSCNGTYFNKVVVMTYGTYCANCYRQVHQGPLTRGQMVAFEENGQIRWGMVLEHELDIQVHLQLFDSVTKVLSEERRIIGNERIIDLHHKMVKLD